MSELITVSIIVLLIGVFYLLGIFINNKMFNMNDYNILFSVFTGMLFSSIFISICMFLYYLFTLINFYISNQYNI